MFTRPPPETSPPPYVPGYIAYPYGVPPNSIAEETRLFLERVKLQHAGFQREQEELERAKAAQAETDRRWQEEEDARRARREKLKETALKAELEWERLGGRVRSVELEGELRKKLDEEANWTDEERALGKAWEEYDKGWERLALSVRPVKTFTFRKVSFTFADVPWPILRRRREDGPDLELEDITTPAVEQFLLHPRRDPRKSRKEKLRDAVLRYHPDKFEGRILHRIAPQDKERVHQGVGIVMQCLNELLSTEH